MRTFLWRAGALAATVFYPLLACAQTATFTKIVSTSTPLPPNGRLVYTFGTSGGGIFSDIIPPARDGASLVFQGTDQGGLTGLFRYDSGSISVVANQLTTMPGSTYQFSDFWNHSIKTNSISGPNVAFFGFGIFNPGAIYLASAGSIARIVDSTTIPPGATTPLTDLTDISIDNNTITFTGTTQPGGSLYGIYRYRNSNLLRIVDSNVALPGGAKTKFVVGSVGGGGGYSAFYGDSSDNTARRSGIYLVDSNDHVSVVADNNTMIPGSSGKFGGFSPYLAADGPDVAFQGSDQVGLGGIYRRVSGSLQLVVRSLEPAPGGGYFSINEVVPLSLDNGHIAMEVSWASTRYGIFTDVGGPLRRIIATGDTLDGRIISDLRMNDDALQGTTLAFGARFTDGSLAIYLATVPEPSTLILYLAAIPPLLRHRRGRSTPCL
jgi:hypothetical protein